MNHESVLSALADPTRRKILESLRAGTRTVSELASRKVDPSIRVSRPAVSQHLKVLHEAGLVRVEAQGTRRLYSVRNDGFIVLRRYIDSYWSDVLTAYGKEVQQRLGEQHAGSDRKND